MFVWHGMAYEEKVIQFGCMNVAKSLNCKGVEAARMSASWVKTFNNS